MIDPTEESKTLESQNIVVHSGACLGLDSRLMQVEASFMRGFAGLQMIGNASEVCRDGKERARAALESCGVFLPAKKIVVSLTPADLKKDGNQFDLPMAVALGVLCSGKSVAVPLGDYLFCGELSLAGYLKPVRGVIACAIAALAAGKKGVICGIENLPELASFLKLVGSQGQCLEVRVALHLSDVLRWVFEGDDRGMEEIAMADDGRRVDVPGAEPNFDDMVLDEGLELAGMVAAIGGHHLLLRGTPGCGKSMFAARLRSLFPPMEARDHITALKVHSSYQHRLEAPLLAGIPPFRNPHHSASAEALLGGAFRPGELSLAHGGVLFLDELPEFRRDLVESLREPLESGVVQISRSKAKLELPARVTLVAACNNCPCGWHGSRRRRCQCSLGQIQAYQSKLSGPLLDRIDMHLMVPEAEGRHGALFAGIRQGDGRTEALRGRVGAAIAYGAERNSGLGIGRNRDLGGKQMHTASGLSEKAFGNLLETCLPRDITTRSVLAAVRVARSLADLEGERCLKQKHLATAWGWQDVVCSTVLGQGQV